MGRLGKALTIGLLSTFLATPVEAAVLLFHRISNVKVENTITPKKLEQTLNYLYAHQYHLVTFAQYCQHHEKNDIALTFDDALFDQLNFKKGVVNPDSAVGIMEQFKQTHPEYNVTATFFVTTRKEDDGMFGSPQFAKQKLEFLVNHGYELGAHTYRHTDLHGMTPEEIKKNCEEFNAVLQSYLPGYHIVSFAYPEGGLPNSQGDAVLHQFYLYSAAIGAKQHTDSWRVQRKTVEESTDLKTLK